MIKAHKKLDAWKEAIKLTKDVYGACKLLPKDEKFGLISHMRRASVSVPSTIAEGAARFGNKGSIQFYMIARGSLGELDTQLEICEELKYITVPVHSQLVKQIDIVDALLSGLIRYNQKKNLNSKS